MNIPVEIWLNIARFIPLDELLHLYSVNHVLFNIAMDARYRTINFEYHREMFENVERLR